MNQQKKTMEDRVRSETDSEVIGRWLKLAVKVNTVAEFENEMRFFLKKKRKRTKRG